MDIKRIVRSQNKVRVTLTYWGNNPDLLTKVWEGPWESEPAARARIAKASEDPTISKIEAENSEPQEP